MTSVGVSLGAGALCLLAQGVFAFEATPDTVPLDGDVVILGELHDNAAHHLNQAQWVATLRPKAVVFEMLEPAHALEANRLQGASAARLNEALSWEERGWPDFGMYHPIFEAAGSAQIFGGAVSRAQVQQAFSDGVAAALGGAASIFALDTPLPDAELETRLDLQDTAHCGLMPEGQLPGMVAVQRLRDAALAQAVIAALGETGGPVAVITGNGHARTDWGVPAALTQARPDLEVVSVAQLPNAPDADAPYDAWVIAPYVDQSTRGDPCDALH